MSYLQPPPMPAAVVVHKDVGGYVNDYEAQTAIYRATGREVRLHECRSACTLALSLPNVCVYPDSILKFHQAYDPHNRQTNEAVSQQLFNSYPGAVRARLGGLTRAYRVLRGSELIALGIRNCNDSRTMVATAAAPRNLPLESPRTETQPADQNSIFDGLVQGVMAALGQTSGPSQAISVSAISAASTKAAPQEFSSTIPLPPARPPEFTSPSDPSANETPETARATPDRGAAAGAIQLPPPAASNLAASHHTVPAGAAPKIMSGAQAILPARFAAYLAVR